MLYCEQKSRTNHSRKTCQRYETMAMKQGIEDFLFKIIIAGSGGIGKTTLCNYLGKQIFDEATAMTTGVSFFKMLCPTKYGKVELQLWELSSQKRFRFVMPAYLKGASGCLLLVDPTRPEGLRESEEWADIVRNNTKDIPILLLSIKQDLMDGGQSFTITMKDIDEFVARHNLRGYMKISSTTGFQVKETFKFISEFMIERHMGKSPRYLSRETPKTPQPKNISHLRGEEGESPTIDWNQFSVVNLKRLIKQLDIPVRYTIKSELVALLGDLHVDLAQFKEVCQRQNITPMKSKRKVKQIAPPSQSN